MALKCKLLWQLLANNLHLKWLELVKSNYFFRNQFGALLNVASNNASLLWQELRVCFPIVNTFSLFSVNNGKKIIFWESKWVSNIALEYALTDLYHISANKKYTVDRMLSKFRLNHFGIFNSHSIRSFNAHPVSSQLHQFINIMESLELSFEENNILWTLTMDNIFSVKSCYVLLNDGGLRS